MKKIAPYAMALAATASLAIADAGLAPATTGDTGEAPFAIRAGASWRGGMKLNVRGAGSRAAGTASSSTRTTGSAVNGKDSQQSSLTFGYTGGERTFGEGTTALGSGTIHADGTYEGGDYSAAYDDVFFSDNSTRTETLGGQTTTKSSSSATGGLVWGDDDLDGWGLKLDADIHLFDAADRAEVAAFAGFRAWWGIKGETSGHGAGMNYRTTTTTSGGATRTTSSFYDVTAPLDLNGKLDFQNAEVFQGSVVNYKPTEGTSSSKRTTAFSVARIEAEADLWQAALGAALQISCGRLSLSLRPALLLNWIDAEATRAEVLATSAGKVMGSWHEESDKCDFALGAGIDLAAEFALTESWSLWISGGYEWIDSVEFDIGPQKVEIDPSAWTAAAGIGYSF